MERNGRDLVEKFNWLEMRPFPKFGVGCSVCRQAIETGKLKGFSQAGQDWRSCSVTGYLSLQTRRLEKHESSRDHVRAAGSHRLEDPCSAPRLKDFHELLAHVRKSPIGTSGISSVGGQKKCRKLLWCVAEARRESKRAIFQSADGAGAENGKFLCSTTLFQDARRGSLSLRFTAANSKLERLEGSFGVADLGEKLDSVGIMHATMAVLQNFSTRYLSPPHLEEGSGLQRGVPPKPALDSDLFLNIVTSIEVFVSDAASDELRAGHMLARQSTAEEYHPVLPRLRLVLRDKPHAVRRNLTRGWNSDPFLHEVADRFVFRPGSPCRLIHFSEVFRAWFSNSIKQMNPSMAPVALKHEVSNLGFAPHRFESAAKPMSRICLFFHPFLITVGRIATERRGETEGKQAEEFLNWLSMEKIVQFSMLADSALENLNLARWVDYQGFPVEELGNYLRTFKLRQRAMFAEDNPECMHSGCCGHMLKVLQRQIAFHLPGAAAGKDVIVGSSRGVPDDVLQRCLGRMRNWVHIAESTIDVEFPSFEVMQCFSVFNLEQEKLEGPWWARHLSTLLRAFHCRDDNDEAQSQFKQVWFVAKQLCKDEGLKPQRAWMEAMRRVTRSHSRLNVKALMPVVVRFLSAGASTSGVEQSFTQAQKLYDNLQIMSHVNDVVEALDIPKVRAVEEDVFKRAADLWRTFYGTPRASGSDQRVPRRDRGCPRKVDASQKPSINGWIRDQAAKVGRRAQSMLKGRRQASEDISCPELWTSKHDKEMNFIQDMMFLRCLLSNFVKCVSVRFATS